MAAEHPLSTRAARTKMNKQFRAKGLPVKVCGKCWAVKAYGQFGKHASRPDGRQSYCTACANATNAAWYAANADRVREATDAWRAANADRAREATDAWRAANADRVRERNAAWQRNNPEKVAARNARRRARKAAVRHEPYDRAALFARWDHTCCYCDAPATDVEHITPISKGGADALPNLTVACTPCNSSKGQKSLAEWALTWA